jgi:HK97 family phage major capsid protein
MNGAILLRKWRGELVAHIRGNWITASGGPTLASLSSIAGALCFLCVLPVLLFGLLALMLSGAGEPTTMAYGPEIGLGVLGITLAEKRKNLDKIAKEAEQIENEYKGKPMPEHKGAHLEKLYEEGEALSIEVDKEIRRDKQRVAIKSAQGALSEVDDPAIPDTKADRGVNRIAGYITPGQAFAMSEALQQFKRGGMPKTNSMPADVKNMLAVRGQPEGLIALTEAEVKSYLAKVEQLEAKDIPVLGTDVIAPQRVDRFVQVTRPDRLTLRDILNVSPTSAPVIEYIREESYSESAGIVSEGAAKPEADVEYSKQRAPVVTIAVWIPVTEQMLQDAPALINRIDNRLLWDIKKAEEQEIGYGDGTGEHFEGIFDSGTGIDAMRDESGDTLIDIVRRGITDVLTDGYDPNGLWIHPQDWETIELAKGSDGHYVWAIVRDTLGPRIWGLRVVEGTGTRKRGTTTTNMAVGDWRAGATLYDRQQASISVGWINDQFIKNMRTIRAEERVAFALEAPKAFRIYETAA